MSSVFWKITEIASVFMHKYKQLINGLNTMTIESSGNALGLNGTCTGSSSARNQIGAEVGKTAGTTLDMNNSCLRTLSGTSSGSSVSFSTFYGKSSSGCATYSSPGTYTWVAPSGVSSVSVVLVGGGGGGALSCAGYAGGGGGATAWRNNYGVSGGSSYTVYVGSGGGSQQGGSYSYFISLATAGAYGGTGAQSFTCCGSRYVYGGCGGGTSGPTGGGTGGKGNTSGYAGGAGGYCGSGGNATSAGSGGGGGGGNGTSSTSRGGGGVGLRGKGCNGAAGGGGGSGGGNSGTNGAGGVYGGGGGASSSFVGCGAKGGARIVWPGSSRSFPSTNVS